MLISGAYLMIVGLKVLIPDTTKKGKVQEAFDGNIWSYYYWKKSNMVFCSLWVIFYSLAIIQFSFCDAFGSAMYQFIVMFTLFAMVIEWLN